MEIRTDWSKLGALSLGVAALYFFALPKLSGLAAYGLPTAFDVVAPVTSALRASVGQPSTSLFLRACSFLYHGSIFSVPLLPLLVLRQPVVAKVALAGVATVMAFAASSVLFQWSLLYAAHLPGALAVFASAALVQHRVQPNNSSKPTPLRGAA